MSRAPRLALALLIVGLGLGLALHMSPSRAGSTADLGAARAVAGVSITVANMDRSIDFYSTVLFFEKVSDVETSGSQVERLLGVPGLRMRVAAMKLGAERIELTEYLAPKGRPVPAASRSNTPRPSGRPDRPAPPCTPWRHGWRKPGGGSGRSSPATGRRRSASRSTAILGLDRPTSGRRWPGSTGWKIS